MYGGGWGFLYIPAVYKFSEKFSIQAFGYDESFAFQLFGIEQNWCMRKASRNILVCDVRTYGICRGYHILLNFTFVRKIHIEKNTIHYCCWIQKMESKSIEKLKWETVCSEIG